MYNISLWEFLAVNIVLKILCFLSLRDVVVITPSYESLGKSVIPKEGSAVVPECHTYPVAV